MIRVTLLLCMLVWLCGIANARPRSDLIFSVPKLVAWLSQGTSLPPGTVIITGTPAGVGAGKKPEPEYLRDGDEFSVEIQPHIGTLTTKFENEK